jgi:hypothetical protein
VVAVSLKKGVDSRISANSDDEEETDAGAVSVENSYLEMVFEIDNQQTVGLRFTNINIPQCSEITSAFVQFTADESEAGPVSLSIHGQDVASAATFQNVNGNVSTRPRTLASVAWSPAPWTAGDAGTAQQTADISSIIQEIVDLPGWSGGNPLALIVTGTEGTRIAVAHDSNPNQAALLHAEYVASVTNRAPRVRISSPLDGILVNQGTNVNFIGTADDCIDGDLSASLLWTSSLDGDLNGGSPAASFSTSALTPGTHVITASVTDSGALTGDFSVTVEVIQPVGPVTDVNGAANEVLDTATPGTPVGITASATDPDGDTVAYSFANGNQTTDDGLFGIDSVSGVITVEGALDFDLASSHQVTVRATSTDTSTSEALFNINVLDEPESVGPVTDVDGAANEVLETATPGTPVGITASATDPNSGDTVSYSFANGNQTTNDGLFGIDSVSGVITVEGALNFNIAPSHQVTVRATSTDTSTSEAQFTINVTNVGISTDVLVDFGGAGGLWARMNDTSWKSLHALGVSVLATGDIDNSGKDDIVVVFPGFGTWVYIDNDHWEQVHALDAEAIVIGNLNNKFGEDIIVDFGPGLGLWARYDNDDLTWEELHSQSPELMAVGGIDAGNKQDLIADFGASGLWVWLNDSSWVPLHPFSATHIVTADIDDSGKDEVIVDFGPGIGIWVYFNNNDWQSLHPSAAGAIATGDLDSNGEADVLVHFPGFGLWVHMNGTDWIQLHFLSPELITTGNMDNDSRDEVIVDFGPGIGIWIFRNNTAWDGAPLHGLSPDHLGAADIDGN